jgi:hypothetical protein
MLKREITERQRADDILKRELALNEALSAPPKPLISPSAKIEDISATVLEKARHLTRSALQIFWRLAILFPALYYLFALPLA